MLASCAAYNSILTDLNAVGDERPRNACALLNINARHKHAVYDLCPGSDRGACEQDGILYLAVDLAALCDESAVDIGVRPDIMRKGISVFRVNLPGGIIEIQLIILVQEIHIGFPQ